MIVEQANSNSIEDHSLFMADISLIEASRSYSDVAGLSLNNRLQSSVMDFEMAKDVTIESKVATDVRVPCDYCGRKFNPDVSLKHVPIC